MNKLLRSKLVAWLAMAIVVAVIIITFRFRTVWWAFIDEFFAFMAVFCQLAAVYLYSLNRYIGKKLQTFAAIFGVLMILSFIGEYIAYLVIYSP